MQTINYPWPDKSLSPNARTHWAKKASAAKKARADAWLITMHARLPHTHKRLVVEFYPPARRGPLPDVDNVIASCKAMLDGIADAIGVNDRDLEVDWPPRHAERVGPGCVRIRFEEPKKHG